MNNQDLITVFTPTYNRASLLRQLYNSLLIQKHSNFEWIIVDDGSVDNTQEVVAEIIAEKKLNISYFYKTNGGKHTAINLGVHKANGGLFFIVDSDDFLANNAMDLTFKSWQEIRNDNTICGLIGLSEFTNGKIVGDKFTHDNWDIPFIDFYLKYHLTGDKSVAFKTEVMKEYPFPEKEGVRYVFEAVVWHEMSKKYKVRCLNTVIQFKEYLDEGISDSSYKMWYLKSMAFSYFNLIENKTYSFSKYPKEYYMNFVYLGVYSLLIKENYFNQLHSFKSKLVFLLVVPRAVFSYFRMRDKVIN